LEDGGVRFVPDARRWIEDEVTAFHHGFRSKAKSAANRLTRRKDHSFLVGMSSHPAVHRPNTKEASQHYHPTKSKSRKPSDIVFDSHNKNIDHRKREQELPRKGHQLIDPETREGAAEPDQDKEHAERLDHEPDPGWQDGSVEAAQEQRGCNRRNREAAQEPRHLEEREFHSAVFGVIAGAEFRFAFRRIKRSAVHFCNAGDEEQEEAQESPGVNHKPLQTIPAALGLRDRASRKRANDHDHRNKRESERNFVRDGLRCSAHSTDQRILAMTRPASHNYGHGFER